MRKPLIQRICNRILGLLQPLSWRTRVFCARLRWAFRLLSVAAGLPLKKEFLVLRCMRGRLTSGLFSEFVVVLGALDHFERWRKIYAGFKVDYGEQGLYFDPSIGPNSWEYHFEPIELGHRDHAEIRFVSPFLHELFASRIEEEGLSRERCFQLIEPYVRARVHIRQKLDAFVRTHFQGAFVIGIHYRGTDKHEEAPRVPYDDVATAVHGAAELASKEQYKLFLATDEQPFLDYMIDRFPGRLLCRPMFRSADGQPIDVTNDDSNYTKGEDAVLDCLLLARCDSLIRTSSNLSLCATFFNPSLPEILLERPG